jgi:dethiobiotin synthetase
VKGLFVTATDTGAGKTYVTARIARLWRRQGRSFSVCKPVATGARWRSGSWESDDTLMLADAAGETADRVTPWIFPLAAAPPVAARAMGDVLHFRKITDFLCGRSSGEKTMLVEGIGGLLCPLTEEETVADLIGALMLPVVLVARRGLGTLNHTLLAVEAIRSRGFPLAGVVLSETTPSERISGATNPEELTRRGIPILLTISHRPLSRHEPSSQKESGEAEDEIDWWSLAQAGNSA